MEQTPMSERDYLTPGEAIEYWGLSQRKFYSFLKEGPYDFLAFYNTRRLILRVSFERYLWRNPTIWKALKNNGKKVRHESQETSVSDGPFGYKRYHEHIYPSWTGRC